MIFNIVFYANAESQEKESNFGSKLGKEISDILVLGDSITDGNGTSGWISDHVRRKESGSRVIFDNGKDVYFETTEDCRNWVYYFKDYVSKQELDKHISITNAAIGEKSYAWGNTNRKWIDRDYDAIIIMLGTNDRWACGNIDEFRINCEEFLEYANKKTDNLIVIGPPPVINGYPYNDLYQIPIDSINNIIQAICEKSGYYFLNLSVMVYNYYLYNDISFDKFFTGGTHLSNTGNLVVYKILAYSLGLDFDEHDFELFGCITAPVAISGMDPAISTLTGIDDEYLENPIFPIGLSEAWIPNGRDFPSGYGGTLKTYRLNDGVTAKQVFEEIYSTEVHIRYHDKASWGEWRSDIIDSQATPFKNTNKKTICISAASFFLGAFIAVIIFKIIKPKKRYINVIKK